jgi:flagellar biogenesis protein FliO
MASIIRIKRSLTAGDPAVLGAGELAYSAADYTAIPGGGRLYIGIGTESGGDAASHLVIGGKYFTDKLDHNPGILTASSALIVDADSKIDNLLVDNLELNGNTLSSTNTNGNIILDPNGSGVVEVVGDLTVTGNINATITGNSSTATKWSTARDLSLTGDATATLSSVDGSANVSAALTLATVNTDVGTYGSSTSIPVITVNGKGLITGVSTQSISTTLTVADENNSTAEISLADDTFSIVGGQGINTIIFGGDPTITISATDASDTAKGIASFNATDFEVDSGDVSLVMQTVGAGTYGSSTSIPVITVNTKGIVTGVSTETISTSFSIFGDTGSDTFNTGENLSFTGSGAINTAVTDNTVTISVDAATTTDLGVASFSSSSFDVIDGAVTIKTGGVTNTQLENDSVTIGSTEIALGETSTSLAGLTEVTVGNITVSGNTITAPNNIVLQAVYFDPETEETSQGVVDVAGSRITEVGDPIGGYDAANKRYVDNVAAGLTIKPSVKAATTADLGAVYDNGASGVGGVGSTLTIPATATLTIDGVSLTEFDGILVKDQTNAEENGRYYISTLGDSTTAWVLTRCGQCDEDFEIPSMYVFVQEGTLYNSTGWVAAVDNLTNFAVGVDDIIFTQFSGAGTYLAGEGLSLDGNEFSVNVGDGIVLEAGDVTLASTVAGDGLTYTNGVLDIGGTADRIAVNADSIDIASTYVGQSSITTVGTITTGTWNGTAVGVAYGGTGLSSHSYGDLLVGDVAGGLSSLTVGASGKVLQSNGSTLVYGDVDGGTY